MYDIRIFHLIIFSEVFYLSDVSAHDYRTELERQLRKMTLGISVGLVKDHQHVRGFFSTVQILKQLPNDVIYYDFQKQHHLNPYAHFSPEPIIRKSMMMMMNNDGRDQAMDESGDHMGSMHKYKICEIRPPSIEKV